MACTSACSLPGSGLLCLLLLAPMAAATQFRVGGPIGWGVPGPNDQSFNHWAERNRFQIGDSLLFSYPSEKDSVFQVSKEDYDSCNTANPIVKFSDGSTVFPLDRSGPFFFISGVPDYCNKNEKLVVVVMADRSNQSTGASPSASPPLPSPAPVSPPPSSAMEAPPSPPPEVPMASPPPPASIQIVPSPAPPQGGESTSPPPAPSAATLKVVGMVGYAGALLGSLQFLVM